MNIQTNYLTIVKAAKGKRNYCIAEQARRQSGLTIEAAAKAARICPRYLRSVELQGGASFVLSQRLARIYGCGIGVFLFQAEGGMGRCTRKARRGRNPRRAKFAAEAGS